MPQKETETDHHRAEMKQFREQFIALLLERKFLRMALVRGRGHVEGYLSSKVGIIKTDDGRDPRHCRVLFHATDIYLFGEPLAVQRDKVSMVVPVGLRVCFDARSVPHNREDHLLAKDVSYQACAVFAGSWPAVPHPTVLPGGEGSYSPCYEQNQEYGSTYYYLQLSLRPNLDRKWQDFCDMLGRDQAERRHGQSAFRYNHVDKCITSSSDYKKWRQYYAPLRILRKDRQNGRTGPRRKKENYHYFKPASERKWNVSYVYTYFPFGK